MNKILVGTAALLVFSVGIFMFLQNYNKSVEVAGYKTANTTYKEIISSTGTVEYDKELEIKAEVSGTLADVYGNVGEKLKAGEVVAKMDDQQALSDFEESKANRSVVKARLEDYMKTYSENEKNISDQRSLQESEIAALKLEQTQLKTKIDETKVLVDAGALPPKDLTNLNNQMASLKLKLEAANKKLESLRLPALTDQEFKASLEAADAKINKQKLILDKFTVQTPVDGIVLERLVEPGSFVQAGEVLMKIASDKSKYAVVDIDEKYLNYVTIGKEAEISTEAYPNKIFKGIVETVSPEVDKDSGTVEIKIKINEESDLFLQNMSVKVEFVGKAYEDAIVIPGDYLIDEENPSIFIQGKGGEAVKKEITILNKNDKNILVLDGLTEGTVVLDPKNLEEGLQVKVKRSEKGENDL